VTAFTATGVSELDVATVVAVPEALEVAATARLADDEEPAAPDLRVVPDNGARLEAAEDALEEATQRVGEAQALVAEAEASIETLNARRLQLQGEADELRRRIAAIEEDVEEVDDELEEAEEVRVDAAQDLTALQRTRDEAEKALDRLRG
jgi:chromosome segregation ATPase